jgi:HlyD family secretion protein
MRRAAVRSLETSGRRLDASPRAYCVPLLDKHWASRQTINRIRKAHHLFPASQYICFRRDIGGKVLANYPHLDEGWWRIMKVLVLVGLAILALSIAALSVVPQARAATLSKTATARVAAGSVLLPRQARLSFNGTGLVGEVLVRPGQRVAEGDVLARLQGASDLDAAVRAAQVSTDSRIADLQAATRSAEAELEIIRFSPDVLQAPIDRENEYNFYLAAHGRLVDAGAPKEDLDKAWTNVVIARGKLETAQRRAAENVAKAEEALRRARDQQERFVTLGDPDLAQTRDNLRNAVLTAPFAGVIEDVGLVAGESARAGVTAATLVDPATLQVVAMVEESDIVNVSAGQHWQKPGGRSGVSSNN